MISNFCFWSYTCINYCIGWYETCEVTTATTIATSTPTLTPVATQSTTPTSMEPPATTRSIVTTTTTSQSSTRLITRATESTTGHALPETILPSNLPPVVVHLWYVRCMVWSCMIFTLNSGIHFTVTRVDIVTHEGLIHLYPRTRVLLSIQRQSSSTFWMMLPMHMPMATIVPTAAVSIQAIGKCKHLLS